MDELEDLLKQYRTEWYESGLEDGASGNRPTKVGSGTHEKILDLFGRTRRNIEPCMKCGRNRLKH